MSRGQLRVDGERLVRGVEAARDRGEIAQGGRVGMSVRHFAVCQRKLGIERHGLAQQIERRIQLIAKARTHVSGADKQLIRCNRGRRPLPYPRLLVERDARLQRVGDAQRDVALHREHVGRRAVVATERTGQAARIDFFGLDRHRRDRTALRIEDVS